jgi:LmbE family N-acetylglucosaminyl deacetylase/glycosyltransferase involved in cell wall biosynthesis
MLKVEQDFIPYMAEKMPEHGKVLVFAPHPDDEVLGCGGAIIRHVQQNDTVKVVIVTNGDYPIYEENKENNYAAIRKNESLAASNILGYGTPEFLEYRDRELVYGEKLIRHLFNIIQKYCPSIIYLPGSSEIHPDHRILSATVTEAVRRFVSDLNLNLILNYYEIGRALSPNKLLDITDVMEIKNNAIDCFASQLKNQDYKYHINSLNAFRTYTLSKDVKFAEGLFTINSKQIISSNKKWLFDLPVTGYGKLQSPDEFDLPMVSIIVRTMNRQELPEALDSIAMQTYQNIEVIVVDAVGKNELQLSDWCGRFPMRIISKYTPLLRPHAANAGLEVVNGEYFSFLDEDDLIHPDHISNLVDVLQNSVSKVAYSGIEMVNIGQNAMYIFNQPFNVNKLIWENYIPIHGLLFKKSIIDIGCRFDEKFDVYEDWDFLIQAAQTGSFVHLNKVTGVYRNYLSSNIHNDNDLSMKFRIILMNKWRQLIDSNKYFEFLEYLRNLPFDGKNQFENLMAPLNIEQSTLLEQIKQNEFKYKSSLERKDEEILNMQININEILKSRAWRCTKPLRIIWEILFSKP